LQSSAAIAQHRKRTGIEHMLHMPIQHGEKHSIAALGLFHQHGGAHRDIDAGEGEVAIVVL
jgi:hypothetical protein